MKTLKLLTTCLVALGINASLQAQCTANATVTPTSTPGEVYIEDFSTASNIYSWISFYDANNTTVASLNLQPYSSNVYYQFSQNGVYSYTVMVLDSISNCMNSFNGTFIISGVLPQVSCSAYFLPNNQNTLSPLTFEFTNSSSSNSNTAVYAWDFGDGNTGSGMNPNHTYSSQGNYLVCLTVSDTLYNGCSATFCDTINAAILPPFCNANFYSYDSTGTGLQLYFDLLMGNSATATYYWDFGDGSTSTLQYPSHTYAASGNYTVCLIVNDTTNGGCASNYCDIVSVGGASVPNCYANFFLWQDSTNVGQYYAYNFSNGSNLTYLWDFGDGNTSTNAYPSHIYQNAGTYVICLTITDAAFGLTCTSTYCDTLNVVLKATGVQLNVLQPGQIAGVATQNGVVSTLVYPNPTNGNYAVEIETNAQADITLSITNLVGQVMDKTMESVSPGKNTIVFDAAQYPSGIYLISVTNNNSGEIFNTKLIKN